MNIRLFAPSLFIAALFSSMTASASEARPAPGAAKDVTVVLVHGAWADGSSWQKVIPLLQEKNINVVAVQNPLTGLADDVAAAQHAIDQAPGAVVLVGHSYGGSVITEAGISEKVKALVYVAAFAPNVGQATGELGTDLAPPPGTTGLAPDPFGFIRIADESYVKNFAGDLPKKEARIYAATQGPTAAKVLGTKLTNAAWKTKSNYYVVASNDRMIQPDLERRFAKMMNAKTTEVPASHAAMLSHPKEVAKVIEAAVNEIR